MEALPTMRRDDYLEHASGLRKNPTLKFFSCCSGLKPYSCFCHMLGNLPLSSNSFMWRPPRFFFSWFSIEPSGLGLVYATRLCWDMVSSAPFLIADSYP